MNLFIIIATLIFIIFITGFIFLSNKSKNTIQKINDFSFSCLTDSDCKPGEKCLYNPDIKKNTCVSNSKKYCEFNNEEDLIKCDPSNNGSECSVCINGSDEFGPNTGIDLSCVNINDDNRNQYKNIKNYQNINGNYCLPKIKEGIKCNIYTSDTILTQDIDGGYKWNCVCKNDNKLFQIDPSTNDCTLLTGCNNGKYPLYVRKPADESGTSFIECTSKDQCSVDDVCWDQYGNDYGDLIGEKGFCYTKWVPGINNNPLTDGICKCESGKYPYKTKDESGGTILECLFDTCQKNIEGDIIGKTIITSMYPKSFSKQCKCNNGYISCPEDIPTSESLSDEIKSIRSVCKDVPQCIKDPCINRFCSNNQSCTDDTKCNSDYSRCINGKCVDTSTNCINDKSCGDNNVCHLSTSHYEKNRGCICESGTFVSKNNFSIVGELCIDLCAEKPCGNRGTCKVDNTDPLNPKQKCINCIQPYSNCDDNTKQCKTVLQYTGSQCGEFGTKQAKLSTNCWSNNCKDTTGFGAYKCVEGTPRNCDN